MKKLTLNDAIIEATNRQGVCLSNVYVGSNHKLSWKCKNEHTFEMSLSNVRNGNHWCYKCAMNERSLSLSDAKAAATDNNGLCLSTKYCNNKSNLLWKCKNDHIWEATIKDIRLGKWCAKCAGVKKLSILDAKQMAKKFNGDCLSTMYIDNKSNLEWKCENGHKFFSPLNNVRRGCWCKYCSSSVEQQNLQNIVEKLVNYKAKVNFRGFEWLKNPNTGRRLEIDMWFPQIKLAIEYNGITHFENIYGSLEGIKFRDKIKSNLIHNNDDVSHFVRISYIDDLSPNSIRHKIIAAGVKC